MQPWISQLQRACQFTFMPVAIAVHPSRKYWYLLFLLFCQSSWFQPSARQKQELVVPTLIFSSFCPAGSVMLAGRVAGKAVSPGTLSLSGAINFIVYLHIVLSFNIPHESPGIILFFSALCGYQCAVWILKGTSPCAVVLPSLLMNRHPAILSLSPCPSGRVSLSWL